MDMKKKDSRRAKQKSVPPNGRAEALFKAGTEAEGNYEEVEHFFRQCLELDATAAVLSTEFFEKKLKREQTST